MDVLLTFTVIAAVLFAWFSIFWVIPRNLKSLFRYKLWRLRDDLADAIRGEEFERTEEPRRVLFVIECFIEAAGELTPLNFLLMILTTSNRDRVEPTRPLSLKGLCESDKERLGASIISFNKAVTRQIFIGSPSGWFVAVLSAPFWIRAWALDLRKRQNGRTDRLRLRVTEDFLSAISAGHNPEDQPLSLSQFAG